MAGKQSDHRIEMERTVLVGDSKRSYLGLLAATFLSLAVIGCGTYVIMNGHDWAGAVIIGVDVVGLAGVFVYGTNARRAERVQKAERRPKSDR